MTIRFIRIFDIPFVIGAVSAGIWVVPIRFPAHRPMRASIRSDGCPWP